MIPPPVQSGPQNTSVKPIAATNAMSHSERRMVNEGSGLTAVPFSGRSPQPSALASGEFE